MFKLIRVALVCCLMINLCFAGEGVLKKSRSSVKIKDIGTFNTEELAKITVDLKRSESKNKFKGKGLAGKLAGKFFAKSGKAVEIINLPEMNIYELNPKKKKCTVRPITNVMDSLKSKTSFKDLTQSWKAEQDKYEKTPKEEEQIEIIKSEFKVYNQNESQTVNNFNCNKFWINAYTYWRDKRSGQTGTDSLSIFSMMTPETETLQKAQTIEMDFSKAYLEKLGMDIDDMQKNLLGAKWLEKLQQIKGQDVGGNSNYKNMAEEMAKLNGYYPVTIDGKYFAIRKEMKSAKSEPDETEDTKDLTDVKKNLGGFAKGLFGKKKPKKPKGKEPILEFYSELQQFSLSEFSDNDFQSPYKCKEK